MKTWVWGLGAVACFTVAGYSLTAEGAVALFFGWIVFLGRVLPRITISVPNLVVALVAVFLLTVGIHFLGRSWLKRRALLSSAEACTWRIRWTLSIIPAVIILFAAGISVVGIVHQVSWLTTSDSPLLVQSLSTHGASENQLRYMHLALVNYEGMTGNLPPGGTFTPNGQMLHSWETHLLPYLGFYAPDGIDMNLAWTDPKNQRNFKCVLPVFINPDFRGPPLEDSQGYGLSHYAVNSRVMSANKAMKSEEIKSGASNLLLIGEVNTGFKPWGHPVNWRDPVVGLNNSHEGFGGASGSGGVRFLVADGSVRFLSDRTSPEVLKSLSTPAGKAAAENPGR